MQGHWSRAEERLLDSNSKVIPCCNINGFEFVDFISYDLQMQKSFFFTLVIVKVKSWNVVSLEMTHAHIPIIGPSNLLVMVAQYD